VLGGREGNNLNCCLYGEAVSRKEGGGSLQTFIGLWGKKKKEERNPEGALFKKSVNTEKKRKGPTSTFV